MIFATNRGEEWREKGMKGFIKVVAFEMGLKDRYIWQGEMKIGVHISNQVKSVRSKVSSSEKNAFLWKP